MNIRSYPVFLVTFLLLFVMTSPLHAFTGKDKIPELKSEVNISWEDFESRSEIIQVTPLDDASLAFKIRLPKGWMKKELEIDSGVKTTSILKQVAAYTSPPRIEQRSIFRVSVIDLDALITVDDWLISYMLEMGFSIQGIKIEDRKTTAQYTVFENQEPYYVQAIATISGSKIILAEYLIHQEVQATEMGEQIWAMTTFEMLSPSLAIPIQMKTFNFVDIAKFDYPKNWIAKAPDITDITRMEASVINGKGLQEDSVQFSTEMIGRVDVSIVSKELGISLADEIKLLNESLKSRNYKLGKFIETVKVDKLNELIQTSRIDAYQVEGVSAKLAGYEYWVAVLQTRGRNYFIRLTTVSREDNYKTWAENVETFYTLLRSLGPASVSLDEDE